MRIFFGQAGRVASGRSPGTPAEALPDGGCPARSRLAGGHGRSGLFLLILALVAALAGCERATGTAPRAREGVLDLSGYDFQGQGPAALDGQWEFYWDRLLAPADFADPANVPEKSGYLKVPGSWKGFAMDGRRLGDRGQATCRLRLLPGPGDRHLMLRLINITSSYKLWAGGVLVASGGVLGTDAATETPAQAVVLAELDTHGSPLDLVLEISNYNLRLGGVQGSILLGRPQELQTRHRQVWGLALLIAGCAIIMGLYHLNLYVLQRKNLAYLYFALLCFSWTVYLIAGDATEWAIRFFPIAIDPFLLHNVRLSCYALGLAVCYRFLIKLYPQEFSRAVQYVTDAIPLIFVPILWIFPMYVSSNAIVYSYIMNELTLAYTIWRLAVCVRRGREGAVFILVGAGMMTLTGTGITLSHAGIIGSAYSHQIGLTFQLAFLLYVFAQAAALAQNVAKAFSRVESLSVVLERKNRDLLQEMAERDRLEREVVNISEEERRRMSHELHDGLCQHLTGARLRLSLLEDQLADGPAAQELARLSELLDVSVDGAYGLSRGLWPVEHDPRTPGPSFDALIKRVAEGSGITVELRRELRCPTCANPRITPLYRIAQEALANAVKHAKARRIRVSLCCPASGGVVLTVTDDGVGRAEASPSKGGLGLAIMAHRARIIEAELEIGDAPGGGTLVRCTAPCRDVAEGGAGNAS